MSVNGVNGNSVPYEIKRGDTLWKLALENNTTVEALLKLNPQIRDRNRIFAGRQMGLPDNTPFAARADYDGQKMNVGDITVNGEKVDAELKSNFFANQNLDTLANAGDKLVINMKAGREINKNDLPAWGLLNKLVQKHMQNNDTIVSDGNGKRHIQTNEEFLKGTDLYKAFISEEINGDNFTGENATLLDRGENLGNKVQFPAVGTDSNGKKYFTLHGANGVQYFDATGQKVEFKDGAITTSQAETAKTDAKVQAGEVQPAPTTEEFAIPQKYDEKQLNLGKIYVNGNEVTPKGQQANYYRTDLNAYAQETLNDEVPSRVDVQLKAGNTLNPKYKDDTAESILLKITKNKGIDITTTDFYKAFVSEAVNGVNFENGKLKTGEKGSNTVQLPALEADENGNKYYVLHAGDKILYFNAEGKQLTAPEKVEEQPKTEE
jgi:hypothetical protein